MPAGQPFTHLCQQMAAPPFRGRVDLHLHTTASDGTYTPAQIVDLALRSGLSAIAITDHDTVAGHAPAVQAAAGRLEIATGVELSCAWQGRSLHLLGYFFDPTHLGLQHTLADLLQQRHARYQCMVARLRQLGLPLSDDDTMPRAVAAGRRNLATRLVALRCVATVREAFQRYLGNQRPAYVPAVQLPVAQGIRLVREAGGVTAWAHPVADACPTQLTQLRDLGLQAIETRFPAARPSRTGELTLWARELGLATTGGERLPRAGAATPGCWQWVRLL